LRSLYAFSNIGFWNWVLNLVNVPTVWIIAGGSSCSGVSSSLVVSSLPRAFNLLASTSSWIFNFFLIG
jgi:hypothetical protein